MKVACVEERRKIESIQDQIANDEVPTHDSAYSSRQTTASPTPPAQPSPKKVKNKNTLVIPIITTDKRTKVTSMLIRKAYIKG